ncbi:MAG: VCBS repeat-containing protein, partial [Anaerolineae bacterium]
YAWNGDGSQKFAQTVQDRYGSSSWGVGASPILADVDDDGTPEILFAYNWDVGVLEGDGTQSSTFYQTSYTVSNSPAIGDIDADTRLEVVVAGGASGGANGTIYIWDLTATSEANPWPMFHRDAAHNGHLPAVPVLSASPGSLYFIHPTGDSTEPTLSLCLSNSGDCAVEWTASAPSALRVTPDTGTVVPIVTSDEAISVGVRNPQSYGPGTHSLGSVTVTGADTDCGAVDSISVPVTLEVGDFWYAYLPTTMRGYAPVLYNDDFNDPASGWPIAEDGETGSGYFGLEYGVHISQVDLDVPRATARGPFSVSGDYAIQVEAQGTTMAFARCGIIFNASADMSRYDYFFVDNRYPTDPVQGSNLWRYEGGSHRQLKVRPVSGATVELYEPNTLRVEVVDAQIRAYVDGVQIISYNDRDPPGGGYVGLYAEHAYYGEPGSPEMYWYQYHKANCHFDDLIVAGP